MAKLTVLDALNGQGRSDAQPVLVEEKPEIFAKKILEKSSLMRAPIDIFKIANDLRLKLYEENISEPGYLLKDSENEGVIFYKGPSFQHGLAWKFTIAHEIGHWVLERLTSAGSRSHETTLDNVEIWCNKFASELLVPTELLKNSVGNVPLTYEKFEQIKSLFEVSEDVLINKLYSSLRIQVVRVKKIGDKFVPLNEINKGNRLDLTNFEIAGIEGQNEKFSSEIHENRTLIGPEIVITRNGKLRRYLLIAVIESRSSA